MPLQTCPSSGTPEHTPVQTTCTASREGFPLLQRLPVINTPLHHRQTTTQAARQAHVSDFRKPSITSNFNNNYVLLYYVKMTYRLITIVLTPSE